MHNDRKGSNAVSFTLGALIGGVVGFLASTKKGRKLAKTTWKKVSPYLEDMIDDAKVELEEVKSKTEEKVEQVKKPLKKTIFKGL